MEFILFMEGNKVEGKEYWQNRPLEDQRKDWKDDADWISGYWNSRNHPHRRLIIEALEKLKPFDSVFEVGCNVGPNLDVIQNHFMGVRTGGIDLNESAVLEAQNRLPYSNISVGSTGMIPTFTGSYDIVLADAVLMYVNPEDIQPSISEMARVAKKAIVSVDWHDEESTGGVINEFHWTRNYEKLLNEQGLIVEKIKLTKEDWPSNNWEKLGYIYVATR